MRYSRDEKEILQQKHKTFTYRTIEDLQFSVSISIKKFAEAFPRRVMQEAEFLVNDIERIYDKVMIGFNDYEIAMALLVFAHKKYFSEMKINDKLFSEFIQAYDLRLIRILKLCKFLENYFSRNKDVFCF